MRNVRGAEDALLLLGGGSELVHDRRLASSGWDLKDLAHRYRRFVASFAPVESALRSVAAIPPDTAFLVRTLLIHEYRKIHLRDPLLPPALLPPHLPGTIHAGSSVKTANAPRWPGGTIFSNCSESYHPTSRTQLTSHATLNGDEPTMRLMALGGTP